VTRRLESNIKSVIVSDTFVHRNSILSLIKSEPVDRGFAISNL
jgi:hypothetical protein